MEYVAQKDNCFINISKHGLQRTGQSCRQIVSLKHINVGESGTKWKAHSRTVSMLILFLAEKKTHLMTANCRSVLKNCFNKTKITVVGSAEIFEQRLTVSPTGTLVKKVSWSKEAKKSLFERPTETNSLLKQTEFSVAYWLIVKRAKKCIRKLASSKLGCCMVGSCSNTWKPVFLLSLNSITAQCDPYVTTTQVI